MPPWVTRALGMGLLHAAAVVALAKIVVFQPTEASWARAIVLALLVGAAALWGALDGWLEKPESGRTWFIASLVAAVLAAVLGLIGRAVFVDQTGISQLGSALSGGAAFTALVVLVPAGIGLLVGTRLAARGRPADADLDTDDGDDAGDSGGTGGSGRAGDDADATLVTRPGWFDGDTEPTQIIKTVKAEKPRKPSPRRLPSPWKRHKLRES